MVSKKVKVVNPSGLHLRPAGVLSQTAMKFKSRTLIECGEKHIVAKRWQRVSSAAPRSRLPATDRMRKKR